jgi:salicylate hydroxylase
MLPGQPSQSASAMRDCHVIIVGAGIGGLTAALSLQRHGMGVSVYEQASELREFGAGLMVTPNAMHALDFLGVGEAIAATSNVLSGLLIKHYRTGDVLQSRSAGDAYKLKYGAGYFQVHRADLHNALSAAVHANDPGCIRLDHAFTDLVQDGTGVVARFANGAIARADALVGCDGGRSVVRDKVHGSGPVTYTGQVAFRALVPVAGLVQELRPLPRCLYIGPGRMFLHYLLRKSSVMNIVAIARRTRWEAEGWAVRAEIQELLELYGDFHPQVRRMIGSAGPDALFKWGLRDREPLPQWTVGRVSALGDAAHPMSPFLGQGAVMAIEDGMVLGRCFAEAGSPEDALVTYEMARKERANAVQLQSREQANALQGFLGEFNPGRHAEERGLFDYNPVTAPLRGATQPTARGTGELRTASAS